MISGLSSGVGLIISVVCSCSCLGLVLAGVAAAIYFLVIKKKADGEAVEFEEPQVDESDAETLRDAPMQTSDEAPSESVPGAADASAPVAAPEVPLGDPADVEETPAPSIPGASGATIIAFDDDDDDEDDE